VRPGPYYMLSCKAVLKSESYVVSYFCVLRLACNAMQSPMCWFETTRLHSAWSNTHCAAELGQWRQDKRAKTLFLAPLHPKVCPCTFSGRPSCHEHMDRAVAWPP